MYDKPAQPLGNLFSSSREKGREGLPLLSVTLNDGLVIRDELDRRTETNLDASEHLLVQKGDIAYNMMRVWQGALGLAKVDGLVSPAYIVLRPNAKIDSEFAAYLFKTPRLIYLFWAYSYGLTKDRLRLYFNDFSRIPVSIPDIQTQKRITEILSTWDKAITTTEQLLANSQQQKKAMMQQLLTGKQRLLDENGERFSGEWRRQPFSDLVSLVKTKFDPKANADDVRECIELEHIAQVSSSLYGSTNTSDAVSTKTAFEKGDVLFGKLRPYLRKYWKADRQGVCSTEIWVFRAKAKVTANYIFQVVQLDSFIEVANKSSGTHMPRADWNVVKDFLIPTPPLDEQQKISTVLTAADQEITTLQQQLDHLKQEKKALMQQLLTGKRRVQIN